MRHKTPLLNGGNVSIYVSDMDRAVRFYVETLGFRLITRIANEWAEIDAGSGPVLGLHPVQPSPSPAAGTVGAINVELKIAAG